MRYSYEFKRKCVELYREGIYPSTPGGVSATWSSKWTYFLNIFFHSKAGISPRFIRQKTASIVDRFILVFFTIDKSSLMSFSLEM